MQKVMPPILDFRYTNQPESEAHLKVAFDRIFTVARQNLLQAKEVNMSKRYFIYTEARTYQASSWEAKEQIVDDQIKTLTEFAQEHSFRVMRVFKDFEMDRKHVWNTEWGVMMNAIFEKQVDGVICDSYLSFEVPELQWNAETILKWFVWDLRLEVITPGYIYKDGLPNGKLYAENEQEGAKY